MMERASTMAFAAGAMVFPGGRIDRGDRADGGSPDAESDLPARTAAIRETIEEVGIAVGLTPEPSADCVAQLRRELAGGSAFRDLLADARLTIDPGALTPFARWCPNFAETRSFDTLFFLARAPAGAEAQPDGSEAVSAAWASAATFLADADAGRRHLIFPTRRTLERLATFPNFAAAVAQATAIPPRRITPWIEQRADGRWLCISEDCGYPITAERLDSAHRG
jgi:8-oxo-dGTP pyrophosphatase MutT (NUDIX family)